MTCSLVVNSKSGNTRMVSGAIKRALQAAGVEFIHAAALSDDADPEQVAHEAGFYTDFCYLHEAGFSAEDGVFNRDGQLADYWFKLYP